MRGKMKRLVVLLGCCLSLLLLVLGLHKVGVRPSSDRLASGPYEKKGILIRKVVNNKDAGSRELELAGADSRLLLSTQDRAQTQRLSEVEEERKKNGSVVGAKNHPSYCLHAFYYMWYANIENDGRYSHWNHEYLPHWNPSRAKQYPRGSHKPPSDIGASFYPKLGCYSSSSRSIMEKHMQQFRDANIGVASVSWYPAGMSDQPSAIPPDDLLPELLEVAQEYGIKVTIHIEPYKKRSPLTVREDIKYIHQKYASHPALFKMAKPKSRTTTNSSNKDLFPLIYVYDSYQSTGNEWANVLSKTGSLTIRGTPFDAVVIGLVVNMVHLKSIKSGGFDGFYTYFASDGFSYASSTRNWPYLATFAKQSNLIFIPSAGPGYEDTRVRPWNMANSRDRKNGAYYKSMMAKAISSRTQIVSITSFNEWHEGTQIEPAVPMISDSFTYKNYEPYSPEYYLALTDEVSKKSLRCSL